MNNKENHITAFVREYRSTIEGCWTNETAHPDLRSPLPSAVLFPKLRSRFPNETFRLATGRVHSIGAGALIAIHGHAWIHWERGTTHMETTVIDATPDQAENVSLPPYLVEPYDSLRINQGVIFQPLRLFEGIGSYASFFALGEPGIDDRIQLLQTIFDTRAA